MRRFSAAGINYENGSKDLPAPDRNFIAQSIARENGTQARARRVRTLVYGLFAVVMLVLLGWINQSTIGDQSRWWTVTRPYAAAQVWPHVLAAAQEQALKPGDAFKECAQDCPEIIVVPAGSFMMGAPTTESQAQRYAIEIPQHAVTIDKLLAVSRYEVTFADWDA